MSVEFPYHSVFPRRALVENTSVRKYQSVNLSAMNFLDIDWINLQVYSVTIFIILSNYLSSNINTYLYRPIIELYALYELYVIKLFFLKKYNKILVLGYMTFLRNLLQNEISHILLKTVFLSLL